MSLCNPCKTLKNISLCTDSIVIGTVEELNTAYNLYFKSLATSKVYVYPVTSNGAGLITLTLPDGFPLATNTGFEMWVNLSTDSPMIQQDLTIGSYTESCYNLSAERIYNLYYGSNQNFTSQTLETA